MVWDPNLPPNLLPKAPGVKMLGQRLCIFGCGGRDETRRLSVSPPAVLARAAPPSAGMDSSWSRGYGPVTVSRAFSTEGNRARGTGVVCSPMPHTHFQSLI